MVTVLRVRVNRDIHHAALLGIFEWLCLRGDERQEWVVNDLRGKSHVAIVAPKIITWSNRPRRRTVPRGAGPFCSCEEGKIPEAGRVGRMPRTSPRIG